MELGQGHLGVHLHRLVVVPDVDQVGHGVAVALDLQGADLAVHGEEGEVHGTGRLHSQPDTAEYFSPGRDPEELVVLGGRVELGRLLVDKEGVRDPDEVDVVRPHHQLAHTALAHVKPQSLVSPELPAVQGQDITFAT